MYTHVFLCDLGSYFTTYGMIYMMEQVLVKTPGRKWIFDVQFTGGGKTSVIFHTMMRVVNFSSLLHLLI